MASPAAKTTTRLTLCLLLGLATTILTAWLFKAWYQKYPTPIPRETYTRTEANTSWEVTFISAPGRLSAMYDQLPPPGSNIAILHNAGDPVPIPLTSEPTWAAAARRSVPNLIGVSAYGWPFHALKSVTSFGAAKTIYTGVWESPFSNNAAALRLPVSPIWPAFLADTAIFSTAWLSVLAGPPVLRRIHRRRRNRCPACGYSLAGAPAPTCPECGAATSIPPVQK